MLDDTYPGRDIPEPLQPPQQPASHGKRREAAGWWQKIGLVLIGVVAGAALVAGGYALAGNRSTANLTPLQRQVSALQQEGMVNQVELTSDASRIKLLLTQVATLDAQSIVLKLDGIASYDETCPIEGVWVPCAAKEPPGFTTPGG